jgi:hypothetical protein
VGWYPPTNEDEELWHIQHDDGDEEDLDEGEVKQGLISYEKHEERKKSSANILSTAPPSLDKALADEAKADNSKPRRPVGNDTNGDTLSQPAVSSPVSPTRRKSVSAGIVMEKIEEMERSNLRKTPLKEIKKTGSTKEIPASSRMARLAKRNETEKNDVTERVAAEENEERLYFSTNEGTPFSDNVVGMLSGEQSDFVLEKCGSGSTDKAPPLTENRRRSRRFSALSEIEDATVEEKKHVRGKKRNSLSELGIVSDTVKENNNRELVVEAELPAETAEERDIQIAELLKEHTWLELEKEPCLSTRELSFPLAVRESLPKLHYSSVCTYCLTYCPYITWAKRLPRLINKELLASHEKAQFHRTAAEKTATEISILGTNRRSANNKDGETGALSSLPTTPSESSASQFPSSDVSQEVFSLSSDELSRTSSRYPWLKIFQNEASYSPKELLLPANILSRLPKLYYQTVCTYCMKHYPFVSYARKMPRLIDDDSFISHEHSKYHVLSAEKMNEKAPESETEIDQEQEQEIEEEKKDKERPEMVREKEVLKGEELDIFDHDFEPELEADPKQGSESDLKQNQDLGFEQKQQEEESLHEEVIAEEVNITKPEDPSVELFGNILHCDQYFAPSYNDLGLPPSQPSSSAEKKKMSTRGSKMKQKAESLAKDWNDSQICSLSGFSSSSNNNQRLASSSSSSFVGQELEGEIIEKETLDSQNDGERHASVEMESLSPVKDSSSREEKKEILLGIKVEIGVDELNKDVDLKEVKTDLVNSEWEFVPDHDELDAYFVEENENEDGAVLKTKDNKLNIVSNSSSVEKSYDDSLGYLSSPKNSSEVPSNIHVEEPANGVGKDDHLVPVGFVKVDEQNKVDSEVVQEQGFDGSGSDPVVHLTDLSTVASTSTSTATTTTTTTSTSASASASASASDTDRVKLLSNADTLSVTDRLSSSEEKQHTSLLNNEEQENKTVEEPLLQRLDVNSTCSASSILSSVTTSSLSDIVRNDTVLTSSVVVEDEVVTGTIVSSELTKPSLDEEEEEGSDREGEAENKAVIGELKSSNRPGRRSFGDTSLGTVCLIVFPWLVMEKELCFSEKEKTLPSEERSKLSRRYHLMACSHCQKHFPRSSWGTLKPRILRKLGLQSHEQSTQHKLFGPPTTSHVSAPVTSPAPKTTLAPATTPAPAPTPTPAVPPAVGKEDLILDDGMNKTEELKPVAGRSTPQEISNDNRGLPSMLISTEKSLNDENDDEQEPISFHVVEVESSSLNTKELANDNDQTSSSADADADVMDVVDDEKNDHVEMEKEDSVNEERKTASPVTPAAKELVVDGPKHRAAKGEAYIDSRGKKEKIMHEEGSTEFGNDNVSPTVVSAQKEFPWLIVKGGYCHSEKQLASGKDLTKERKICNMMMCSYCHDFVPDAVWAKLRPRHFQWIVFPSHENSRDHKIALLMKEKNDEEKLEPSRLSDYHTEQENEATISGSKTINELHTNDRNGTAEIDESSESAFENEERDGNAESEFENEFEDQSAHEVSDNINNELENSSVTRRGKETVYFTSKLLKGALQEHPWLIIQEGRCHSKLQLASGLDLSKVKKQCYQMQCSYCRDFSSSTSIGYEASQWAVLTPTIFRESKLISHESNSDHQAATAALAKKQQVQEKRDTVHDVSRKEKVGKTSSVTFTKPTEEEVSPSSSDSDKQEDEEGKENGSETDDSGEDTSEGEMERVNDSKDRFNWLEIKGKSHSFAQLSSGKDLSDIPKQCRLMRCSFCSKYALESAWATARPRYLQFNNLFTHEISRDHQDAVRKRALEVPTLVSFVEESDKKRRSYSREERAAQTKLQEKEVSSSSEDEVERGNGREEKRKEGISVHKANYPWLLMKDELCFSEAQLSSGKDLDKERKQCHMMKCLYCSRYGEKETSWTRWKPKHSQLGLFVSHEISKDHQKAKKRMQQKTNGRAVGQDDSGASDSATEDEREGFPDEQLDAEGESTSQPQWLIKARVQYPWLIVDADMVYSEKQLASGKDLSNEIKPCRLMACSYCKQYWQNATWGLMKPRQFRHAVLSTHESSFDHREAAKDFLLHKNGSSSRKQQKQAKKEESEEERSSEEEVVEENDEHSSFSWLSVKGGFCYPDSSSSSSQTAGKDNTFLGVKNHRLMLCSVCRDYNSIATWAKLRARMYSRSDFLKHERNHDHLLATENQRQAKKKEEAQRRRSILSHLIDAEREGKFEGRRDKREELQEQAEEEEEEEEITEAERQRLKRKGFTSSMIDFMFVYPWLVIKEGRCYSEGQLKSGKRLSSEQKQCFRMKCLLCDDYWKDNPWGTDFKPRYFHQKILLSHENSKDHVEAAEYLSERWKKQGRKKPTRATVLSDNEFAEDDDQNDDNGVEKEVEREEKEENSQPGEREEDNGMEIDEAGNDVQREVDSGKIDDKVAFPWLIMKGGLCHSESQLTSGRKDLSNALKQCRMMLCSYCQSYNPEGSTWAKIRPRHYQKRDLVRHSQSTDHLLAVAEMEKERQLQRSRNTNNSYSSSTSTGTLLLRRGRSVNSEPVENYSGRKKSVASFSTEISSSLSSFHQEKLTSWLESYRLQWTDPGANLSDAFISYIVTENLPVSVDEIYDIPKKGRSFNLQYHGTKLLATLYAFLEKYDLLRGYPAIPKPEIEDCPTWVDPLSRKADEIRKKRKQGVLSYQLNKRRKSSSCQQEEKLSGEGGSDGRRRDDEESREGQTVQSGARRRELDRRSSRENDLENDEDTAGTLRRNDRSSSRLEEGRIRRSIELSLPQHRQPLFSASAHFGKRSSRNGRFFLSSTSRERLREWLFKYREQWTNPNEHLSDSLISFIVDEEIPFSLRELDSMKGKGKSFNHGNHGQKLLSTLYSFLERHMLLDNYPSFPLPDSSLEECPTWKDPLSSEAEAIRREKVKRKGKLPSSSSLKQVSNRNGSFSPSLEVEETERCHGEEQVEEEDEEEEEDEDGEEEVEKTDQTREGEDDYLLLSPSTRTINEEEDDGDDEDLQSIDEEEISREKEEKQRFSDAGTNSSSNGTQHRLTGLSLSSMFSLPLERVQHNRVTDSSALVRENEDYDNAVNRDEEAEREVINTSELRNSSVVTFLRTDMSISPMSPPHRLKSLALKDFGSQNRKRALEEEEDSIMQLQPKETRATISEEGESHKKSRIEDFSTHSTIFTVFASSSTDSQPTLLQINQEDLSSLKAYFSSSSSFLPFSDHEDLSPLIFDDAKKTKILALLSAFQSNEASLRNLLSSRDKELSALKKSQEEREQQLLASRKKEIELLKEKLHRRNHRLSSYRKSLGKVEHEVDSLQKTILQRNQLVRSLQSDVDNTKAVKHQLTEKNSEISLLQNDNKVKQQQIISLQSMLEKKEKEMSSVEKHYSKMIESKNKEIEEKESLIMNLQRRNKEEEEREREKGRRMYLPSSHHQSDGEDSSLGKRRDSFSEIDSFSSSDSFSDFDLHSEERLRVNDRLEEIRRKEDEVGGGVSPSTSALPSHHEYMQASRRLNSSKTQFQPQIGPNYQVSSLPAFSAVDDIKAVSYDPDNNDFYEVIWKASDHADQTGERDDEEGEEREEVDEATRKLIEELSGSSVRRSSRLTTINNYPELVIRGNKSSSSLSSSSSFSSSATSLGGLHDFLDSIPVSQHIAALSLLYSDRFDYDLAFKKLKEMERSHPFDLNLRILGKEEREIFKQALIRYGDEEWNQVRVSF